jgi:hypothetical protein
MIISSVSNLYIKILIFFLYYRKDIEKRKIRKRRGEKKDKRMKEMKTDKGRRK